LTIIFSNFLDSGYRRAKIDSWVSRFGFSWLIHI
jgi:hypothetical protein